MQHEELTNENLMELEAQRKDEDRQEEEEVTEEPKRFTMQEMARGCVEWYVNVALAVQNAVQCHHVICD